MINQPSITPSITIQVIRSPARSPLRSMLLSLRSGIRSACVNPPYNPPSDRSVRTRCASAPHAFKRHPHPLRFHIVRYDSRQTNSSNGANVARLGGVMLLPRSQPPVFAGTPCRSTERDASRLWWLVPAITMRKFSSRVYSLGMATKRSGLQSR